MNTSSQKKFFHHWLYSYLRWHFQSDVFLSLLAGRLQSHWCIFYHIHATCHTVSSIHKDWRGRKLTVKSCCAFLWSSGPPCTPLFDRCPSATGICKKGRNSSFMQFTDTFADKHTCLTLSNIWEGKSTRSRWQRATFQWWRIWLCQWLRDSNWTRGC